MSDMIERLANTFKEAQETWVRAGPMMDGWHLPSARHFIAIAILRELQKNPTPEMVEAGTLDGVWPVPAWEAMIGEALKNQP